AGVGGGPGAAAGGGGGGGEEKEPQGAALFPPLPLPPPPALPAPPAHSPSVRLREPGFRFRGVVTADAVARRHRPTERHVADRRLRLGLDLRLALGRSAPRRDHEAGTPFHDLLELVVARRPLRVLVAELLRPPEHRLLHPV